MTRSKPARAALAAAVLAGAVPAFAEPPPLAAYGGLPGVEDVAISPSGKGIAVVGRIGGVRRLLVLDAAHKPRANTPVGDTKLVDISWAGEDRVLFVDHATLALGAGFIASKSEFLRGIVVPLDGSKPIVVFQSKANLLDAVFGSYGIREVGGRWLGYFGGIELQRGIYRTEYSFAGGSPALFAVDLTSNTARKVSPAPSDGRGRDYLIDGNGVPAAILELADATGRWRITGPGGAVLASGTDPLGNVSLVGFGQAGDTVIYALESAAENRQQWFEAPRSGGAPRRIFADVAIDRVYVDSSDGRLIGYLTDATPPQAVFFDPAKQAAARKIYRSFPKLQVTIEQWTPDFRHVLVHTSGNGDSGSWYIVDVAELRAQVVDVDYPLIAPENVGPISQVSYRAGDGLELDGILSLPPGRAARNLPVIVMPHGGPEAHDTASFDWWAQAFASRGYAVLQPNFRGSTNRDIAFRRAGYGQWGRKMQTDLSDGVAELARQGIVDPKRACIVGASYGGYAALAGVTLQRGVYRCAVAVAPVSDLTEMYLTDYSESGGSKMLKRSFQEMLGPSAGYDAVSPRRHAAQTDAPIMLIHGKDDTVVPFRQSSAMAEALKASGKPYEFVVLPGEDHWLSRDTTRKQMLEAAVRFVGQHNPAD